MVWARQDPTSPSGRPKKVYRVFGLTLASDFPFANRLVPAGTGDSLIPDLAFALAQTTPPPRRWEEATPIYASDLRSEGTESSLYLYRVDDCEVLRFTGVADFFLWSDRIVCHLVDAAHGYLVELRLLGPGGRLRTLAGNTCS